MGTKSEVKETKSEIQETQSSAAAKGAAAKTAAGASTGKLAVAVVALAAVIAVSTAVIVDKLGNNNAGEAVDPLSIGYAAEAKVFTDQDALQAAMDEAIRNAQDHNVALRYQNDAFSEDGVNFECYIANSTRNLYDMFLTICTDPEMTDQVFLSQLLRPGTGFDEIALSHALEPGTNTVYVAVTLVDTRDDGSQTIKSQVVHTMDFHVE